MGTPEHDVDLIVLYCIQNVRFVCINWSTFIERSNGHHYVFSNWPLCCFCHDPVLVILNFCVVSSYYIDYSAHFQLFAVVAMAASHCKNHYEVSLTVLMCCDKQERQLV